LSAERHRVTDAWSRLLLAAPGRIVVVLLLLTVGAGVLARQLTINTNQLDLISQDLRQVKDLKRVVDMVGGAGHLIVALRGSDEARLRGVADDTAAWLLEDKARVREVTHKVKVDFLRDNAALFMQTDDLVELKRRVMLKLKDAIKRASPFFVEIRKTEPYELKLDDLIDKYRRVGRKDITDDYYISEDKQMVLLLVKPMWDSNKLGETGDLVATIRARLASYSAQNARGARLVEEYSEAPDADPAVVEFGFTGSYQTNYDDSFQIQASLAPVSTIAFAGVLATLLLFFGRRIGSVLLVITGLVLAVVLTFGFARMAVGELNMITSILGGILMGIGIDFGIHVLYRLRYEFGQGRPFDEAIVNMVRYSGPASLASALGTGAAFLSLVFSEFRGFSDFGLLAGAGVLIIGVVMYLWVPAVLVLLERRWPGVAVRLLGRQVVEPVGPTSRVRLPAPRMVLVVGGALCLALIAAAPRVGFEYNTRALMVENQPSVRLQDEVNARFQISADPVAVYTRTPEETERVYKYMSPLGEGRFSTVQQVASMYTFVPPADQQARNAQVLAEWRAELAEIDRKSLPAELEGKWDEAMKLLDAKPYTLADVPTQYRDLFKNLATSKPENAGYLTFVYPTVDLWDGKQMMKFADEVETLELPNGEVFHSAGLAVIFAKLARIVLFDGRLTMLLTALLLVVILYFDFKSIRSTAVALLPLGVGMGVMFGIMALSDLQLNFMNIVVLPIVLGYGVSHGVYLMHRFQEGVSPVEALRTVGLAVACSTLTTLAGWGALLWAGHRGMKSLGALASIGIAATLVVSFTLMTAVLQILHDRRTASGDGGGAS